MKAIVAMTLDRAIGHDGKLPWPSIKEDFHFFKGVTKGKKIVMGSRTHKSLPKPYLKDRDIYVLSRNRTHEYTTNYPEANCNVNYISFKNEVPQNFSIKGNDVWLCGGAELYKFFLPICTDLYVTIVLDNYVGDVFMPEFDGLFNQQKLVKEYKHIWIVHYWNKTSLVNEAYREGFDAKLSGLPSTNPYTVESNLTGVGVQCNKNWQTGFFEAPSLL